MGTISFQRLIIVSLISGLIGVSGCAKPTAFNKDVGGVLTVDGKPLPNVMVTFVPMVNEGTAAPQSFGLTDEQGNFQMKADGKSPGAAIAKFKIVISLPRSERPLDDSEDPPEPVQLPLEYLSLAKTPIEVDVTAEKHSYPIDLKSQLE